VLLFFRLAAKIVAGVVLLVLLVLLATAGRIWWFARQDDTRQSDVIVVLGAAQFDGRPSSVFTARLVHARDLWQDDVAPRIITVGGKQDGDRFTEASAGKSWLTQHGVPAARIVAVGSGNQAVSLSRWLVDGCTQAIKPKFSIVHQFTSVGSRLSLVATLQIPNGPPIDPATNGLRLELADGEGNVLYTRTVSAGSSWSVNGRGTAWKYTNPAGPGGIQTIRIVKKVSKPGQVKIVLKARDASYGYQSVWLPPKVRVTFDYLAATPVQCSEANFYLGYCMLTGEEETLKCSSP